MTTRWLAAAALLLTLGGCGDDLAAPSAVASAPAASAGSIPSSAPAQAQATGSPTARPPAPDKTPQGREATGTGAFVAVVQDVLPDVALDRREEELAAVAERACTALAAGAKADKVVAQTRTLGTADATATDQATARELIKLAIDTVCPDQDRRVDEF
ncbi:DUF732 domain-containing protein [Actinoplanes sp. NPDC051859]|uniref:DUF732 domain-containing protein n=1 Tax=Actinoplanes sp. NPDC051859 TaxID=3363909 RepID=UPI003787A492